MSHGRALVFLPIIRDGEFVTDIEKSYAAMTTTVGAVWVPRDVITVAGPDATTYLQGQLTQDIEKLATGESALSFILQPHGKVDGFLRVTRSETDAYVLDTDEGFGESLIERLTRFKLRTKADIAPVEWKVLALRGPDSSSVEVSGGIASQAQWRSVDGVDIIGANPKAPNDVPFCDFEAFEALRIESGIPVMGAELDERTIPAEVSLNDKTISFTKGCYTGQELVARIDSRGGNVPRRLCGVVIESREAPPRGASVVPDGKPGGTRKALGTLTSSAYSPGLEASVALAYIRRDALTPTDGALQWDAGPTPCRVVDFPITRESS